MVESHACVEGRQLASPSQFRGESLSVVDFFQKPDPDIVVRGTKPIPDDFREADPLEAPLRSWEDLKAFDEQRRSAALREEPVVHRRGSGHGGGVRSLDARP